MNKDYLDYFEYFEAPEFKTLFSRYQKMKEKGISEYFDADELVDITEYYYNKGMKKEALTTLEFALKMHPDNVDVRLCQARTCMNEGDYEQVQQLLDSIIDQTDREVLFLRAELNIIKKDIPQTSVYLNQIIQSEEEPIDIYQAYIDIGELFLDYEEYERAMKYFTRAEKSAQMCEDPQELVWRAQADRAICLFALGEHQKGIDLVNQILDEDPYSHTHWCLLGEFYVELEEFDKAMDAFDYALAIQQDYKEAIFWKACCYTYLENNAEALKLFHQCIEKEYKLSETHFACGVLYNTQMEYSQAIFHLKKSEELMNGTPRYAFELYTNLADAYIQSKLYQQAIHYIMLADPLSPDNEQIQKLYKEIENKEENI